MLIRVNFRFQDFVLPFFLPTLASGYKGKLKQPLNTGGGQSFSPAFAQMPSSCLVPGKVCGVCWVGVGLVCTSAVVFCWHAYASDHGCSHCLYFTVTPVPQSPGSVCLVHECPTGKLQSVCLPSAHNMAGCRILWASSRPFPQPSLLLSHQTRCGALLRNVFSLTGFVDRDYQLLNHPITCLISFHFSPGTLTLRGKLEYLAMTPYPIRPFLALMHTNWKNLSFILLVWAFPHTILHPSLYYGLQ